MGFSVTLISIGAPARAVSCRSRGMNPSFSNRIVYSPGTIFSSAIRPPSVLVVRGVGPSAVTRTLGTCVPVRSVTRTANVAVFGAGGVRRRCCALTSRVAATRAIATHETAIRMAELRVQHSTGLT